MILGKRKEHLLKKPRQSNITKGKLNIRVWFRLKLVFLCFYVASIICFSHTNIFHESILSIYNLGNTLFLTFWNCRSKADIPYPLSLSWREYFLGSQQLLFLFPDKSFINNALQEAKNIVLSWLIQLCWHYFWNKTLVKILLNIFLEFFKVWTHFYLIFTIMVFLK